MISSALTAGVIANAGMRLRFPLIDAQLAATDRAMGLNTSALVLMVAERPFVADVLNWAYTSIFPLTFATAMLLSCKGAVNRLWELTLGFGASIVIAATISVFLPALGHFLYAGLDNLSGHGLPVGSGIYHMDAVATYREGSTRLLDLRKLDGVVTFPSFHMIAAIVVAYAFRGTGWIGRIVQGWCALVAFSTIPIGGH